MSEVSTLTGHNPAADQLPEGWYLSPIGDHATISTGKIDVNASVADGQFPFFTCARETYRIDVAPYEGKAVLVAGNGDLNVKYFEGRFNAYQRTYFLFSKNEESLLPKYLFHFLQNYVHHLRTIAIGTTIKYIKLGDLRDALLSVPPLAEQERIVEILEEQLSRLDAALESVRVVREKAAQFRRSLLHAAFTGTLTGHNRIDWADCSLGELATINYGYTESASDEPIGPKFLRITDLRIGGVSWNEVPFCLISETELEKHRLVDGDIVFARTWATTGKSFLVKDPPESVCASYLIRLQPNCDLVDPNYLNRFFQSDEYWAQIHGGISGTAQGGFNATKLSALVAPIPPLLIQQQIVQELDEQLSRLDAALAVADVIQKRSAALRRSLLHAAFTGRLTEKWRESVHV
jgi:type I restriction enzyme S subunit